MRRILTVAALVLCIGACQKGPADDDPSKRDTTAAPPQAHAGLQDVIERTPQYLVGITFPPVANQHPLLAKALKVYADRARADLTQAVNAAGSAAKANLPYDLSLNFTDISPRPDVVVIAADGSLYTGGAHGIPLIARFTYLPEEKRLLQAGDLVTSEEGWKAISDYVRKELADEVGKRLVEDDVPEEDRAEIVKNAAGTSSRAPRRMPRASPSSSRSRRPMASGSGCASCSRLTRWVRIRTAPRPWTSRLRC